MPNNMNLHRNIFFKDCAKVPAMPFSALDSYHPVDLWNWMDGQRKAGNELLAISHNANLSDGRMFPTEVDINGPPDRCRLCRLARAQRAADRDQAAEGHVGDAPAALAQRRVRQLRDHVGPARQPAGPHSAHRRQLRPAGAEGRPRACRTPRASIPFKFGFGAASDSHNTAVPYRQDNFFGGHTFTDGTIEARMSGTLVGGMFDARIEGTERADGRLGRGEHARLAVRRHAAQGDLRRQSARTSRCASSAAGSTPRRAGRQGLGEDRLREGRADGRRSAAAQAARRRRSWSGR